MAAGSECGASGAAVPESGSSWSRARVGDGPCGVGVGPPSSEDSARDIFTQPRPARSGSGSATSGRTGHGKRRAPLHPAAPVCEAPSASQVTPPDGPFHSSRVSYRPWKILGSKARPIYPLDKPSRPPTRWLSFTASLLGTQTWERGGSASIAGSASAIAESPVVTVAFNGSSPSSWSSPDASGP